MVKNKPDMKDINSKTFDSASDSYEKEVQNSINFSGIQHDVLVNAKINLLKIKSKSLNLRPNSHILDIGCGKGLMHSQLTSIGFKVTGIDVSKKSLEQAKLLNPECSYSQFDGSNIPFEADTFAVSYTHLTLPTILRV